MPVLINDIDNLVQPSLHRDNDEFLPEETSVIDEDASVHGSSVMDEREDVNSPVFDHILDGYAYMSSDSDINIMDQAPEDFTSLLAMSSATSENPNNFINEQIIVDSDSPNVEPVVSESEAEEILLEARTNVDQTDANVNVQVVTPPPPEIDSLPHTSPSTNNDVVNAQTAAVPSQVFPSSVFSFTPPTPVPLPRVPSIPSRLKSVDFSSTLRAILPPPPTLQAESPTSSSSAAAVVTPRDVQGRTFSSKGGDVSVDIEPESDYELQDIIESIKSNRNKKQHLGAVAARWAHNPKVA
ncbi:hypothetical protein BD408DRAFT_438284 [Parasitella parasitica]|nr:hypothetical protein BD408DRAFT_438284 [Parasitella parasitica]